MKKLILTAACSLVSFVPVASAATDKTDMNSNTSAVERLICSPAVPSAAYQPGVDVNGNPVAPADVAASSPAVPDYFEVPLTVDLAKRLSVAPTDGAEMRMPVGSLKIYKNGRVEYNGQDISQKADAMCGRNTSSASVPVPADIQTSESSLSQDAPEFDMQSADAQSSLPVPEGEPDADVAVVMPEEPMSDDVSGIEPAAGQDKMTSAQAETIVQKPQDVPADSVVPQTFRVLPGSVALSTTVPVAVDKTALPRIVNRAPVDLTQQETSSR